MLAPFFSLSNLHCFDMAIICCHKELEFEVSRLTVSAFLKYSSIPLGERGNFSVASTWAICLENWSSKETVSFLFWAMLEMVFESAWFFKLSASVVSRVNNLELNFNYFQFKIFLHISFQDKLVKKNKEE